MTKLSFVAKNALEAYLIVSDVVASVTISGAPVVENSSPTIAAAWLSSAPTTIRSGCRLSRTAVPSRKNSGLETTLTSERPITCSTMVAEPTGTVDLLTTIEPDERCGPISLAAASTKERSADPSGLCGVATQRKTKRAPATASVAEPVKRSLPAATLPATRSSSPASTMGMRPRRSAASRAGSHSARTTEWPKWASVAAVGKPT